MFRQYINIIYSLFLRTSFQTSRSIGSYKNKKNIAKNWNTIDGCNKEDA